MSKEKKKWESPKLICLYRGRPEEAVLSNCKTSASKFGPGIDAGCKNAATPCVTTFGT